MNRELGRPLNPSLSTDSYHDLERRSLPVEHSKSSRDKTGALGIRITEITSNTTLTGDYDLVLVDCSGGEVTVTLPAAAEFPFKQYRIKKVDSTLNPVKVVPDGVEEIDDELEWLITNQYNCMDIVSDGTDEWFMV